VANGRGLRAGVGVVAAGRDVKLGGVSPPWVRRTPASVSRAILNAGLVRSHERPLPDKPAGSGRSLWPVVSPALNVTRREGLPGHLESSETDHGLGSGSPALVDRLVAAPGTETGARDLHGLRRHSSGHRLGARRAPSRPSAIITRRSTGHKGRVARGLVRSIRVASRPVTSHGGPRQLRCGRRALASRNMATVRARFHDGLIEVCYSPGVPPPSKRADVGRATASLGSRPFPPVPEPPNLRPGMKGLAGVVDLRES